MNGDQPDKKEEGENYYVPPTEDEMRMLTEQQMIPFRNVRDLHSLWIEPRPNQEFICTLLINTLKEGTESLNNFEKWGMHHALQVYDSALEVWDARSYEAWEQEDEDEEEPMLQCETWLQDTHMYIYKEKLIQDLVMSGYAKINR
jgi:hypothetical protein